MLPVRMSQTWWFDEVLSLATGLYIPEDECIWHFCLHMHSVLDIALALTIDECEIPLLQVLIA